MLHHITNPSIHLIMLSYHITSSKATTWVSKDQNKHVIKTQLQAYSYLSLNKTLLKDSCTCERRTYLYLPCDNSPMALCMRI